MRIVRLWSVRVLQLGPVYDEALQKINCLVRLVVESLLDHGEAIPEEASESIAADVEPRVAVTV